MKIYSHYGFNDFIICLGYKGYMIKEYFANYFLHQSDLTIDIRKNNIEIHDSQSEPWKVTLVDTGSNSMTGGRIKRIEKYMDNETFMLTYGDGLSNVISLYTKIYIISLINFFYKENKKINKT